MDHLISKHPIIQIKTLSSYGYLILWHCPEYKFVTGDGVYWINPVRTESVTQNSERGFAETKQSVKTGTFR